MRVTCTKGARNHTSFKLKYFVRISMIHITTKTHVGIYLNLDLRGNSFAAPFIHLLSSHTAPLLTSLKQASTLSSSICCMEMKAYHLSLTTPSKAFVCVCVCVFYFLICHEQIHLTVAEDTNISVPCIVSTTDFSFGFSPVRNLIVAKWPGAKATNLYPGNDNFWLFCPNHNCILNGYFYSLYFESHSRDVFSLTKSLAAACLKENSLSLPQKSCYLHHAQ